MQRQLRIGARSASASEASRSGPGANAKLLEDAWRALKPSLPPPRLASGPHAAGVGCPQLSNQVPGKIHHPHSSPFALESHRVADKSFANRALAPLPLDLAIAPDLPHRPIAGITQRWLALGSGPGAIHPRRRPLLQSFVRANLVVALPPPFAAALLCPSIPGGRPRDLRFEHPVHLLVTRVLLRVAGSHKFHPNPQCRPPSTQLGQTGRPRRAKRTSIVHTDNAWISISMEQSQEHPPDRLPSLIGQHPHLQKIAAEEIANRQWLRPLAIPGPKPSFEVHRPNLVAAPGQAQHLPWQLRSPARPPETPAFQTQPLEPVIDSSSRRHPLSRIGPSQGSGQLATAPTTMSAMQLPNRHQPSSRELMRGSVWTVAPLPQPPGSLGLESPSPLVPGPTTDVE